MKLSELKEMLEEIGIEDEDVELECGMFGDKILPVDGFYFVNDKIIFTTDKFNSQS